MYHMSRYERMFIPHYVSCVTCHLSHITCHLSPVTCHQQPQTLPLCTVGWFAKNQNPKTQINVKTQLFGKRSINKLVLSYLILATHSLTRNLQSMGFQLSRRGQTTNTQMDILTYRLYQQWGQYCKKTQILVLNF